MTADRLAWPGTAAALAVLLLASSSAQQPPAGDGGRLIVSERTAAAIDRGIREHDPAQPPRGARSGERFLRGSIVVKFRDGAAATARQAMLARVNGVATRALPNADFDVVSIDPRDNPEAIAATLAAQPDVEYAQARYRVHPYFVPNDPLYSRQWNYRVLDMERAWDLNPGATASITVAVLDSGVAFRDAIVRYNRTLPCCPDSGFSFPSLGPVEVPFAAAPDLAGDDRFVAPHDFIWGDDLPFDLDGHGTHVAGTIGQRTDNGIGVAGMAFQVRIMPVKIVGGAWDFIFGSPFVGTDDVAARAVRYAADNGADVINLSVGRSGPSAPVVEAAIRYAVGLGAFVVVAGGNGFEDGNDIERFAEFAPNIDGLVSVSAIGPDRQRAFYSTTGDYIELAAPGGAQRTGRADGILQQTFDVDFVDTFLDGPSRFRAPRFDVFTFDFFQGTSMAAPHVSGFAALLKQQGITDPAAIEAAMKRFATDLGAAGRDPEYGDGLINPRATLRGLGLLR